MPYVSVEMSPPIDAFATRSLGLGLLFILNLVLAKILPLTRRELRSALVAALAVGALDVMTEAGLGLLGLWRYDLSVSVLGIPVDLFFDVSMVTLAVCLGYAAALHRGRAWSVGYALATTLVLGSWAVFHNTQAVAQGIIRFAPPVDVGTSWFVLGNYALVGVLVVGASVAYRVASFV